MFSATEYELLTISYFQVISDNEEMVEVQSRNGHIWAVIPLESREYDYYMLLHKHERQCKYHLHGEYISVLDAVLEIINHDDYKLKRKSPVFEELVKKYS